MNIHICVYAFSLFFLFLWGEGKGREGGVSSLGSEELRRRFGAIVLPYPCYVRTAWIVLEVGCIGVDGL